ncbi:MAG: hypothetical protein AB1547_01095 [Thermodesulfobacteriota bacterium]
MIVSVLDRVSEQTGNHYGTEYSEENAHDERLRACSLFLLFGAVGRTVDFAPCQQPNTYRLFQRPFFRQPSLMESQKRINEMRNTPGVSVWQRNDYEHILRDEESFNKIWESILNNPQKWKLDRENSIQAIHVGAIHESPLQYDEPWHI